MSIYKDITLIIVCFHSEELIKKNLNVLMKFKTVIIDNSNSKKTYDLVKDIKNIKYIVSEKNIGYGKANNLGVKHCNTPFIFILNPDILINVESIEVLYNKFSIYDNVGLLAPSLYTKENKRRTNGSLSHLKKKNFNSRGRYINNFPESDACYDYVIGCSLFMKKNFFNLIGGFDKDFFMYFEDNDICDRIYKNYKSVIEVPDSKMIHMQGLSSNYDLLRNIKLSIIHKISEYLYLSKNFTKLRLSIIILKHFFDYAQRSFVNLLLFKFKKSFKNILRLISIILYISNLYKLIY